MIHLGSRLLAVLALAALACNKTDPSTRGVGSPSADAAGTENAKSNPGQASKTSSDAATLARSFVSVATTSPSDAQPCERTCGRVGDCLLEADDVSEFEAGRLELECLDQCVHSPADAQPRAAFLACEQKSACGDLLGCVRSTWDPLVATRVGPAVQGVVGGGDLCEEGCRWLYSCVYTGKPPGDVNLAGEYEEVIRWCEGMCPNMSEQERQQWIYFVECMPSHCSQETFSACMLDSSYW